ncbi:MAG: DUF1080 domain-containing protein [Ginsengibacter sp.]
MKNKWILFFAVISFIMVSYSVPQNTKDNTLTKKEKAEGYFLLFDGKTMDGWRTFRNQSAESWAVDGGTLHCKGSAANYGAITADLMTKNRYENFDFSVDWKISYQGNSGILYMVTEDSPYSYQSGPEYQIIDDKNFPEKLEDWQHTAANYAMNPAPTARPHPSGEWNHTRIIVNGNHVEHWLNGKKVVEYELYSPDWYKRKAEGKWKDYPIYGKSKSGYITFQNHGSEAWFKNIKIKKL